MAERDHEHRDLGVDVASRNRSFLLLIVDTLSFVTFFLNPDAAVTPDRPSYLSIFRGRVAA